MVEMPHAAVSEQLANFGIRHTIHRHTSLEVPIASPADFANAIGVEIERICKTLLVRNGRGTFIAAVASAPARLDLQAIARALNLSGRIELASRAELALHTGYPPNGVSPFGLNGMEVVVDEAVLDFPTVLVGAGVAGVEIEVSPLDLVAACNAHVARTSIDRACQPSTKGRVS